MEQGDPIYLPHRAMCSGSDLPAALPWIDSFLSPKALSQAAVQRLLALETGPGCHSAAASPHSLSTQLRSWEEKPQIGTFASAVWV